MLRRGAALSLLPLLLVVGAAFGNARDVPDTVKAFTAAAPPPDSEPEPVLIELQIGRLVSRTVQAYRVRTEVLLPLTQLLEMAEIRYRLSPEGRLEGIVDPGDVQLVVDAARDTIAYGSHRVRLEPAFKLFRDGELYIGSERLGDLLGIRVEVDWSDLRVTLLDASTLPIGRRVRREATRDAFLRRGDGIRPDLLLDLERPRWDGLVLDYSLFSPSTDPLGGSVYTVALGADAFGGSLELGAASVGTADAGALRLEGSWTGVWRDARVVRQLRVGDGLSTGPRIRTLQGVSVTNAPYVRPSLVGSVTYDGRIGPGWTVEAYRGGDLVAYDSTDAGGRFAVELPVRYGENPVDFVAYGPFGEVRELNRTFRVIGELLPAGRFEYGLSGGACRSAVCRGTANLDLRHGLSRRWTIQAGAEQFWRDTVPDLFHPYLALTGGPSNSWAIEVEAVGRGFSRGGVRYEPSLNLRLTGEYTRFSARTPAPVIAPAGRRDQWGLFGFWRPVPRAGFVFLDGSVERARTTTGANTRARLGASLQGLEIRVLPFVRLERDEAAGVPAARRTFVGLSSFVLPRPRLGGLLDQLWLRASLEAMPDSGFSSASAFVARSFGTLYRVEAGVSWHRGVAPNGGQVTYSLLLAANLPFLRSYSAVTAPSGGPALATHFVQGAVLWDRATRRPRPAPGPSLERSGIAGTVFVDENGNGRHDPAEPAVPNVRVLVGSGSARSDSRGLFRVWDIVPFEPILVRVDSLTLESPLLVPAVATVSIVPGPNRFRLLDIPIVQAGVIEGRVRREDGRGVGGITLRLRDRRSGVRRSIVTFSDGDFYALGVKPGEYELAVEERVLDVLGLTAEPQRFALVPTAAGVNLSGIELVLRPRP